MRPESSGYGGGGRHSRAASRRACARRITRRDGVFRHRTRCTHLVRCRGSLPAHALRPGRRTRPGERDIGVPTHRPRDRGAGGAGVKSTVPPGSARTLQDSIGCGRIDVVSNPEFLREGRSVADFLRPERIVVGGADGAAVDAVTSLYPPFPPIFRTDWASAELAKYACNSFLAVKASYTNELADLCSAVGADVTEVTAVMAADPRIGGAFLAPGPGWGGSCLPRTPAACSTPGGGRGWCWTRCGRRCGRTPPSPPAGGRHRPRAHGGTGGIPGRISDRGPRSDLQGRHRRRAGVARAGGRPRTVCPRRGRDRVRPGMRLRAGIGRGRGRRVPGGRRTGGGGEERVGRGGPHRMARVPDRRLARRGARSAAAARHRCAKPARSRGSGGLWLLLPRIGRP